MGQLREPHPRFTMVGLSGSNSVVECDLAKVEVAGSNPVSRSNVFSGYIKSINTTVDQYRAFLEEVRDDTLVLANCDFDSGQPTKAAEYSLTDVTYAKLLARLSERKFDLASTELRDNILQFYSDLSVPIETKKDGVRWQAVLTELDQLKAVAPVPTVADSLAQ
jgi:hypothetical protein